MRQAAIEYLKNLEFLLNFEADTYYSKIDLTTKDAQKLVEAGFEYVTGEYDDGGKILRKPK